MKPICLIMITLCLSLLFCGPVWAQHAGPYVGAFLGGNALVDAKSSDGQGSFNLKYNPALQGSFALGWDFEPHYLEGEGRVELEYARRSNPLDKVEFAEGTFTGSGDMKVDSLLLNCIGVFRNQTQWAPYILLGLGAARMEASGLKVTGQPLSNDNATVFAYQLGTGIDYTLTDSLSLDLGYRFFNSTQPKFTEANGNKFGTDYFSHSVILGLRLGF